MDQVPGSRNTPQQSAESVSHDQEQLTTGMAELNVSGESTEIWQCDTTEPPRAIEKKPANKTNVAKNSNELSSPSETFYDAVTGSHDIPESYQSNFDIAYGANKIDFSLPNTDGNNANTNENESIRDKTLDVSDMPGRRPVAKIPPSILWEPDSSLTSASSDSSNTEVKQIVSTSGPGEESRDREVISSPKKDIDMLLVGKTGHGKSSTGNSILGRKEFQTSSRGSSATFNVHVAWTIIDDYIVKVIDGPGVAETRLDTVEAAQKACDDMAKAMSLCPKGFHALLLVLRFGERFTKEEEDCIAMLKSIFGEHIVRDYCVIVITHGELFDMEDDYDDFSDWLLDQEGPLKKLFIECSYRCVLMRNKTEDENTKKTQVTELLETICKMKYRDVRYTNAIFTSAQKERYKLIVRIKAPELKEEIMRDTNLIVSNLTELKKNNDDLEKIDTILLQMEERVKVLLDTVVMEDNQTGVLNDLRSTVCGIQQTIETEKLINIQRKEDKKKQYLLIKRHEENIAKLNVKHAEAQRELEQKLTTASDDQRKKLEEKLVDLNDAYKKEMEKMNRSFDEQIKEAKKQTEKWQDYLDKTSKDHEQQKAELQSKFKDMVARHAEALKNNQTVSEQLKKLQNTRPPLKDPNKATLYCQDVNSRIVSITILKTSPIGELMDAYCGMTGLSYDFLKFVYNGKRVHRHESPKDLDLGDNTMLDVFDQYIGAGPIIL